MEKINVAELLKDCPKGMELDSSMYENCTFEAVFEYCLYPIQIKTPVGLITLNKYGSISQSTHSKCIIFPKGKTTWEGFVPPCKFKDGDIVVAVGNESVQIFLLKQFICSKNANNHVGDCFFGWDFQRNELFKKGYWSFNRLATEEEKEKLFKAIKDNDYRWDEKTKTLEELFPYKIGTKIWVKSDKEHKYIHTIVGISRNSFGNLEYEVEEEKTGVVVHYPKSLLIPVTEEKLNFNVGDKIRHKEKTEWACTIVRVEDRYYVDGHPTCYTLPFSEQNDYELVSNKFDITTLKPFDKVLTRDNDSQKWGAELFSFYDNESEDYHFQLVGTTCARYCIPYEGNEHLLGTDNDCDDYYKTWE